MRKFLETVLDLCGNVGVTKIRGDGEKLPNGKTRSPIRGIGYFDDVDAIIQEIEDNEPLDHTFYLTLNPFENDKIKVENRIWNAKKGGGVRDKDVVRIVFLLLDFDPVRLKGAPSTEEELEHARRVCEECRSYLSRLGWPDPIVAMSGSGYHLLYRVSLENDKETKGIISMVYDALRDRFGATPEVLFDTAVKNAATLCKVYGTTPWYLNASEDRPTRQSYCEIPDQLKIATIADLLKVVAKLVAPKNEKPRHTPRLGRGDYAKCRIDDVFKRHNLYRRRLNEEKHAVVCPWWSEHSSGTDDLDSYETDTVVFEAGHGKWPRFHCSHAHCMGRSFSDLLNLWDDIDKDCDGEYSHIRKEKELARPYNVDSREEEDSVTVNQVADLVMEKHHLLCPQSGRVLEWDGISWKYRRKTIIQQYFMEHASKKMNRETRRNEAYNYICVRVSKDIKEWNNVGESQIALNQGMLDVVSGELTEHNMTDYLDTNITTDYDKTAVDCPTWDRCMTDWFGGDDDGLQKIRALQEFFGQTLLAHNKYKKAMILYGKTDTGKSIALETLRALVGEGNSCNCDLNLLGDIDKRSMLVGKYLNYVPDLGRNTQLDDGGFKAVTGGDSVQMRHLYQEAYEYTPFASHCIVTNNLPKIDDRTDAVYNRLIIIQFNKRLAKAEQDVCLAEKLRAELPAILNWAIAGAKRLIQQNEYTEVPSSVSIIQQYKKDQNPGMAFIMDQMIEADGGKITFKEWRDKFNEWNGRSVGTRTARDYIVAAGYDIIMNGGGETIRGLVWRSDLYDGVGH